MLRFGEDVSDGNKKGENVVGLEREGISGSHGHRNPGLHRVPRSIIVK